MIKRSYIKDREETVNRELEQAEAALQKLVQAIEDGTPSASSVTSS